MLLSEIVITYTGPISPAPGRSFIELWARISLRSALAKVAYLNIGESRNSLALEYHSLVLFANTHWKSLENPDWPCRFTTQNQRPLPRWQDGAVVQIDFRAPVQQRQSCRDRKRGRRRWRRINQRRRWFPIHSWPPLSPQSPCMTKSRASPTAVCTLHPPSPSPATLLQWWEPSRKLTSRAAVSRYFHSIRRKDRATHRNPMGAWPDIAAVSPSASSSSY